MGDRPSATIAQVALKKTAEMAPEQQSEAKEVILNNSYMDDVMGSNDSREHVKTILKDVEIILEKGGSVSLQQTNMEDNMRYYYEGSFSIIDSKEEWKKIECSLSDGSKCFEVFLGKFGIIDGSYLNVRIFVTEEGCNDKGLDSTPKSSKN